MLYFCFMEVNDALFNKLATLARLQFSDEEKETIKGDLERMIQFVKKIEEADTNGIAPLEHIAAHENAWRDDVATNSCSQDEALQNSAEHNDRFFMVPKVIKK